MCTCASVSYGKRISYDYRESLRELFLPPGYKYTYMNYSLANYLRSNFEDHGKRMVVKLAPISAATHRHVGQKLTWVCACVGQENEPSLS